MKKTKTQSELILEKLIKLEEKSEKNFYKFREKINGEPSLEQQIELDLLEREWTTISEIIHEVKGIING